MSDEAIDTINRYAKLLEAAHARIAELEAEVERLKGLVKDASDEMRATAVRMQNRLLTEADFDRILYDGPAPQSAAPQPVCKPWCWTVEQTDGPPTGDIEVGCSEACRVSGKPVRPFYNEPATSPAAPVEVPWAVGQWRKVQRPDDGSVELLRISHRLGGKLWAMLDQAGCETSAEESWPSELVSDATKETT